VGRSRQVLGANAALGENAAAAPACGRERVERPFLKGGRWSLRWTPPPSTTCPRPDFTECGRIRNRSEQEATMRGREENSGPGDCPLAPRVNNVHRIAERGAVKCCTTRRCLSRPPGKEVK
jgi:hypothetical protein